MIELTTFITKLLIKSILIILVQTNKHQYNVNIMHSRIINKTKYDDPRKLIKQTSFTVKKHDEKPSQKTIHYNKEKFHI